MIKIPVYQPSLTGNEKRYVNECLDSTWISSKGRFINKFETRFADYIGIQHATGVCNGTVAIHLALLALGIGEGDEVIVPTLTYIASVNAIAYTGATPVFVDSLEDTWQMDSEDVRKKITSKTRAIMVVHLYGHPCEMESLVPIARENNLFIVEDCAEAFGSLYKGRHVGVFGDISTFSFFGNKTITTGEGGMVVTNDDRLYERAVHFKGQGLAKNGEYWHDVIGFNYRMTNICAAIGLAQLEQADAFIRRKIELAGKYREAFEKTSVTFHSASGDIRHSYWMISILAKDAADRERIRAHLKEKQIETRPLFYPAHTMPMYLRQGDEVFPVARNLSCRGINLPSWPGLSDAQVEYVADCVKEAL